MASATADILPVCVIHKILCYLSYKEASRMTIISKTWLQAWLTLPNLKLRINSFEGEKIVDSVLERYSDEKISIDKFEFSYCSRSDSRGQLFPRIDKWLDMSLQNGAKDIVYEDPNDCSIRSYTFPIIKVLEAKSLRELVLSGCDLILLNSLSGAVYCHSLRKLSLSYLSLADNKLHTLLNSCPLIVSFILDRCWGLRKIELLNLRKIKSISIRAIRNEHVKIQAPTLEHLSYNGYAPKIFEVVKCQNLKFLDLSRVMISDEFLRNLISRSQYLKVLKIRDCPGIRNIDASNLESLEYMGSQIPELKMASDQLSQLKHSKIDLDCYNNLNDLNELWFCTLRKFLSKLTSSTQISLLFFKCNEINMNDLQLRHGGSTPQVDILNVNIILQSVECPTFVDALLWSCHPRRLKLSSTVAMNKCFINRLMYMKTRRRKPWHSQLKEVKAFDGQNQPIQLKRGKLASTINENERKEVYFLLDWRCS